MGLKYIRNLSEQDRRALAEFYRVLDERRSHVSRELLRTARSIPALESRVDHDQLEKELVANSELERAALYEGRWDPYLSELGARGKRFAQLGIELRDWVALLAAYRHVILGVVLPDPDPQTVRLLEGVDRFLDITMATVGSAYVEAKESAVRTAEHRLGLYIDLFQNASLGMAIYECDDATDVASYRLMAVNPSAAKVAGASILEGVGKTIAERNPEVLGTDVPQYLTETLANQTPRHWEVALGPPSDRRCYECRSVPLGPLHLGLLFEDTTERHRAELEVERYTKELERSNKDLDEFAYVASHDLKSPLRDIQNLAMWIAEDVGDSLPADSARHLRQLQDRVSRMERLLEDLLLYSRAGRISEATESFALRDAIDAATALVSVPSGFELAIEGPSPLLRTARAPLEQVLRNLLGNAVKHHDRDSGRISVCVEEREGWIEVGIVDDGPGIPEQFHERVFRMFQTLRPRDQVEGSGMGLAIVKKVVESHGGQVGLESDERGTKVRFTWPKAEEHP